MKLYYTPGACSMAAHLVLRESGKPFELERVDLKDKVTETGADFRAINPKGAVPALALTEGDVLTEAAAIVQFIADRHGATSLSPVAGTIERARVPPVVSVLLENNFVGRIPLGEQVLAGADGISLVEPVGQCVAVGGAFVREAAILLCRLAISDREHERG